MLNTTKTIRAAKLTISIVGVLTRIRLFSKVVANISPIDGILGRVEPRQLDKLVENAELYRGLVAELGGYMEELMVISGGEAGDFTEHFARTHVDMVVASWQAAAKRMRTEGITYREAVVHPNTDQLEAVINACLRPQPSLTMN
jgi:hypothetical protein